MKKDLFGGKKVSPFLDFSFSDRKKNSEYPVSAGRISISGVQEKFGAVVEKGKIRLCQEGEQSTYILKPAPWDNSLSNRNYLPVNEFLTMQIASLVYGIKTATCGLCFSKEGHGIYITKRFDILPDGTKCEMEDMASILNRSEMDGGSFFKYSGCYEDIARVIKNTVSAWSVDLEIFFNQVVFNYIYGNSDAHLKNFSIIRIAEDYRLAPSYDLLNTTLHIAGDDFALNGGLSPSILKSDAYQTTGHPCRLDFERFGLQIGLKPRRIERILAPYASIPDSVIELVNGSMLSDKLKRTYLRIVKERTARFNRG